MTAALQSSLTESVRKDASNLGLLHKKSNEPVLVDTDVSCFVIEVLSPPVGIGTLNP